MAANCSFGDEYNFLNEIGEKYARVLIQVGLKRIEECPEENPVEFIRQFLVPRKEICKFLMNRWKKKQEIKNGKQDKNLDEIFDRIHLKLKELQDQFKKKNSELNSSKFSEVSCKGKGIVEENKREKCCSCFKIPGGTDKSDICVVIHSKGPVKICQATKKS